MRIQDNEAYKMVRIHLYMSYATSDNIHASAYRKHEVRNALDKSVVILHFYVSPNKK